MPKSLKNPTADCIIPVFNEEKTLSGVLTAVLTSGLFSEVIVVNDGSTDKSFKIAKKFKTQIKIVNLACNMGKGYALAAGIKKSQADLVAFIDADALNLSQKHLESILKPFRNPKISGVVGFGKLIINNPAFLQGDRAYRRRLLVPYSKQMEKAKFGVELFLETLAREKKWPCRHVQLTGIKKLLKFNKTGFSRKTLINYATEIAEIVDQAARIQTKSAKEKLVLQKNIVQEMLSGYFKSSQQMIKKIIKTSKNFQKLKDLLD